MSEDAMNKLGNEIERHMDRSAKRYAVLKNNIPLLAILYHQLGDQVFFRSGCKMKEIVAAKKMKLKEAESKADEKTKTIFLLDEAVEVIERKELGHRLLDIVNHQRGLCYATSLSVYFWNKGEYIQAIYTITNNCHKNLRLLSVWLLTYDDYDGKVKNSPSCVNMLKFLKHNRE